MITQILNNLGLKPNGDYTESAILKAVIPPLCFYDFAFNHLREIKLLEQNFNNYQRNLYIKSRKKSRKFAEVIFKGVEPENQNILLDYFDDFEDYINTDVAILRNCLYNVFSSIKEDKRQLITNLFLIFVLVDMTIMIFDRVCGGKRFRQLNDFRCAVKKLVDNLTMMYGEKKEIIGVSRDDKVFNAANMIITKITNYEITK